MFPINIQNILAVQQEEYLEAIRNFNGERRLMRNESNPFALSDIEFKKTYRLTKEMAHFVLNSIIHDIDNGANMAIPNHLKFFAALSFYATGSYQKLIGQSYNISISQPAVSRAISVVTHAIIQRLGNDFVKFPSTIHEKNAIKGRFMEATGFPGVIGAIDCTHIAILAPHEEEHNYLNRKGFHSKNVQLVSKNLTLILIKSYLLDISS